MKFRSACRADAPLVLYHAVSSYQLLEVMLHRLQFHSRDRAVLLLPDFITRKYPQYRKLRTRDSSMRCIYFRICTSPMAGRSKSCRTPPGATK